MEPRIEISLAKEHFPSDLSLAILATIVVVVVVVAVVFVVVVVAFVVVVVLLLRGTKEIFR